MEEKYIAHCLLKTQSQYVSLTQDMVDSLDSSLMGIIGGL